MILNDNTDRYSAISITLHWLMLLVMAVAAVIGIVFGIAAGVWFALR